MPPPFGTGSPSSTTRGLYSLLENGPEQWASTTTQSATAPTRGMSPRPRLESCRPIRSPLRDTRRQFPPALAGEAAKRAPPPSGRDRFPSRTYRRSIAAGMGLVGPNQAICGTCVGKPPQPSPLTAKELLRDRHPKGQKMASDDLEGRLAALEPAFVIALEGAYSAAPAAARSHSASAT